MENMKELDIVQFWKDDEEAHKDNCFNPEAGQVALGIRMSDECVFAELGVEGHPWGKNPPELMRDYTRRYNDKAEKIVGRRLLSEEYPPKYACFPYVKRIGEIFGGRYFMHDDIEWLEGDVHNPKELEDLLDAVEKLDMEDFIFPADWDARVKRIYEETGLKPEPQRIDGRHIRGPTTLATSIYGVEGFLFLYYDEPELLKRFSKVLGGAIMHRAIAIDKICGYNETNKPAGFSFADDNCCLVTPEFYNEFSYPILKRVFDYYSPNKDDARYQHSDSAMAQHLPTLGKLNFTGVNFGPTVLVDEIRKHLPRARIDGCLHPLVFMRNEADAIVEQVKRDCQMAIASGVKGLNLTTAGSINNGSSLESMRLVMQGIQNFGRYE
jgi:uroporphyrinogen decarboxylase